MSDVESIDDDVATRIARSMGWSGGHADVVEQDYTRLPEFGPRKIHSTPEIEPDPLDERQQGMFRMDALYRIDPSSFYYSYWINQNGTVTHHNVVLNGSWTVTIPHEPKPPVSFRGERQGKREAPPRPTYKAKFYERRPTEPVKVGRPKKHRR